MGSNSDVSAFFRLRFRNGLGTKPAGVLPFRMRVPNTFFLSLAWWLAGFFFVFSRVQKQRFGSFLAAVSHGLGPISFSFFHGLQQRRFGIFPALRCALLDATFRNLFSLFLVGSKSNVSAVFWLRFRMVWALYFFLFSGFQKRRFGILLAAVSQWLRHKTYWGSAFSHARPKHLFLVSQWLGHKTCWGSAFSHARPKHLFLEFGLVACRFFLCFK